MKQDGRRTDWKLSIDKTFNSVLQEKFNQSSDAKLQPAV